jgi:excisionase family DNA binding protein
MILTISEAARRAGVSRSTLYVMKEKGKISFTKDSEGQVGIDKSELDRIFQKKTFSKQENPTSKNTSAKEWYLQEKITFLENQLALEQDRVATLLEINKNNSEKLLLTHQEQKYPSLWKRIVGGV